jgi:hypothetical protein
MTEVTFSLPPIKEFRNHITFCLGYVLGLAGYLDLEEKSWPMGLDWIDTIKVTELWEKLQVAGENRPIVLSKSEILLSYLCHDLMNKFLLTQEGENFSMIILNRVSPMHHSGAFDAYRKSTMNGNSHIMLNIENHLSEDRELVALKDRLSSIELS